LIGILIAVVVVVGIVAGADLLLSFAVIRRVSALQARMQGGGGSSTSPAVGHQIGDFEVELLTGGVFTLADLMQGASVVIFLTTTCEPCQAAIAELRDMPTPVSFPMYVLINETDLDQDNAVLSVAADMPQGTRVAEISASHPVMRAFGIDGFPSVLGVEDGIVRASDYQVGRVLETAHR
jgi:hypothetical protein